MLPSNGLHYNLAISFSAVELVLLKFLNLKAISTSDPRAGADESTETQTIHLRRESDGEGKGGGIKETTTTSVGENKGLIANKTRQDKTRQDTTR